MEKIIDVGSWSGFDVNPVEVVKVAAKGFTGEDRRNFLEKRAASPIFADALDNISLRPGDIPIHLLAIGATEGYGCNRNGDGFKEATCKQIYNTFVKHAHYYRYHQNKDPAKRYGIVKLAAYNAPMRRIELLLFGNGTKEAAQRNGGLVMLDSTLEKVETGADIPFSMACKVAFDVCNNCFNKAANRSQYCTESTCINPDDGHRGHGCRTGLTKLSGDGRQQYVENPNAQMFDISEVGRPADRIAYGSVADYLEKAASAGRVMGGAELAEAWANRNGYDLLWDTNDSVSQQLKLAHALADIERDIEASPGAHRATARAFIPDMQPPMDLSPMGKLGSQRMFSGFAALASQKIAMSFRDFARLITGGDEEKSASLAVSVTPHLPGVYNRLIAASDLSSQIRNNPFSFEGLDGIPPLAQRSWAKKQAQVHSFDTGMVQERAQRSVIRNLLEPSTLASSEQVKTASANDPLEGLARQYALYKLAFLVQISQDDPELPLTSKVVVLQNYVI